MFRVVWFAVFLLLFAADTAEAGCRRGRLFHRRASVSCGSGGAGAVSGGGCAGGSCSVR